MGVRLIKGKNKVDAGIDSVRTIILSGNLLFRKECVKTWEQMEGYRYKMNEDSTYSDEVVKRHDHLPDALRYAIYSFPYISIDIQNKVMLQLVQGKPKMVEQETTHDLDPNNFSRPGYLKQIEFGVNENNNFNSWNWD
jgi:hypothetical protein